MITSPPVASTSPLRTDDGAPLLPPASFDRETAFDFCCSFTPLLDDDDDVVVSAAKGAALPPFERVLLFFEGEADDLPAAGDSISIFSPLSFSFSLTALCCCFLPTLAGPDKLWFSLISFIKSDFLARELGFSPSSFASASSSFIVISSKFLS